MKPLAIDLFCGLGGWSDGLLAEGWRVIGYDIERHEYGDQKYPGELVLQDVLTIHGRALKDADLIVASPPCQEYSYMAMPWSRAKAIEKEYLSGKRDRQKLTALFDACFRIQREASEAAGRHIPLVIENVRGAQKWVGKARWNFGSYYLWGDVPALMPIPMKRIGESVKAGDRNKDAANGGHKWDSAFKVPGFRFDGNGRSFQSASVQETGFKSQGMNWSDQTKRGQDFTRLTGEHCEHKQLSPSRRAKHYDQTAKAQLSDGVKGFTPNGEPLGKNVLGRKHGSKSTARKSASAMIAKIPFPLAQWIARTFKPKIAL